MLTREMRDFDADPNHMYTILDVMVARFGYEAREFKESLEYFREIQNSYLGSLGYEGLLKHAKKLLTVKIQVGGSAKTHSGRRKLPEPATVLRKFAYLSSAINDMVKKGVNLTNHSLKVVAYLRECDKEVKSGRAEKSGG